MTEDKSQKGKSDTALREEDVLKFWQENKIFEQSLKKPAPQGEFVFYEGPPTANAAPALHHLEARAFKDAIPRYKTMRGYRVRRRAGWDTHGLPVELQIEKELGFTGKPDIENYGVELFNEKCRESVYRYINVWEKFTDRLGYWVDKEDAYYTFDTSYMESLWSIAKKVSDDGRLYKDYKVVPWCSRCGTALSSHELAQGYKDVKDLSITAKFRILNPEKLGLSKPTFILAWTTTPWTLPGNVALAVGPEIDYVYIGQDEEVLVVAKERATALGLVSTMKTPVKGKELVGLQYDPLYPIEKVKAHVGKKWQVLPADFVTTEDGTGVVHTAVMYGTDDFELGTKEGLPKVHLVRPDGVYTDDVELFKGRSVLDEELAVDIVKDLSHRGLLFTKSKYEHSYPFCWRCSTRLIYYARDSWYIRMTDLRDSLIAENNKINWEPSHIREGRFGEWLSGVKDWAISRERYWGTPLPVWASADGKEQIVIGSLDELEKHLKPGSSMPRNNKGEIDLHKPYIDDVILVSDIGTELRRVKEVMDVWFDSGAMPFAQEHYPFESKQLSYPADFISEAIDQTRGWFYTLLAVGVLMGRGTPYKNVICLGHLLDATGAKMSKSKGNVIEPFSAMDEYGADLIRYWMYSVNAPGEGKSFDPKVLTEMKNKVFNPLINSVQFYEMYKGEEQVSSINVLDQWMQARLDGAAHVITEALDRYDMYTATREVRDLVGDVSLWFVRRSRDRLKGGSDDADAARGMLRHTLLTVAQLMAPFTPFIAEQVYQKLRADNDPISVHLTNWPETREVNRDILAAMSFARTYVSMALMRRAEAGIKIRQPLQKLSIRHNGDKPMFWDDVLPLIRDEVNVKEVVFVKAADQDDPGVFLDVSITEELKEEGDLRDLVREVQDLRKQAGLSPKDQAVLTVPPDRQAFVKKHWDALSKATGLKSHEVGSVLAVSLS
jgi:isoleucyl-tRNA synthetase